MVKTYTVPADFSVSNPRFLDVEPESSFNIPAGDEVSAAECAASSIHSEFSGNPIDEWSDLLGGSPSPATTTLESLFEFQFGDVVPSCQVKAVDEKSEAQDVANTNVVLDGGKEAETSEDANQRGVEPGTGTGEEGVEIEVGQPEGEQPQEQRHQQAEQQPAQQQTWTVTVKPSQAGRTAQDEISSRIISVKTDIRSIDSEISELAAELKELKKTRGEKLEMLLELAEELEGACDSLLVGNGIGVVTATHDGEQSKEVASNDQQQPTESTQSTQPQFDTYNPWDKWEQGETIPVVRVLVDQPATDTGYVVEAGSALETFDIEPPQEDGNSLTGIVKAFLPNQRKTIVLSKRECCPLVHWIPEAKVGWRIGEAPAEKVEKLVSNEPLATGDEQEDSWRSIPVGELHLPKSLESILIEDNSIATIGDIAEWTRWKRLTDLKKVGEAKAEKIQEALDQFWAKWGAK